MTHKESVRSFLAIVTVAIACLAPQTGRADAHVVGVDPSGDWGADATYAQLADVLGQDLVSASIDNPAPGQIVFVIGLHALPPTGGIPELSRYTWDMLIDNKTQVELDGKFTNFSRGACDPTSGQCLLTPDKQPDPSRLPRDPGLQPFLVRGNCDNGTPQVCQEIGIVHATFDAATATISIPVPLSLIAPTAPGCIDIWPGTNLFGGSVSAEPSAFLSTNAVIDTMDLDSEVPATVC